MASEFASVGRDNKVKFVALVFGSLMAGLLGQPETVEQPAASSAGSELSATVLLDRADAAVQGELDRAKALLAARQWEEAVGSLRELMDRAGDKLTAVTPHRFIPLRDYGHLLLSQLPPEGLAVYRRQVDGLAQKWYEEGRSRRDPQLLRQVVEQAFASSWTDEALWLLGEMALEAGQYSEARWYWERLIPVGQAPGGQGPEGSTTRRTWLTYPDPAADVAAVRARLVWTSILEGSFQRAKEELEWFARLHPQARGRLAGREVQFVEALQQMLGEASGWPRCKQSDDWPTFAGTAGRNGRISQAPPLGPVRWRATLPICPSSPAAPTAVAELPQSPLCYFPVVAGPWVFVNTLWEIYGWDRHTGKPLWHEGRLYQDPLDPSARESLAPAQRWGRPRCTLTVHAARLYARMGSPVTSWGSEGGGNLPGGYLVCLDLEAEGRLVWKAAPEDNRWAFEGAPVADGRSVYAAMRRSELGPHVQTYVVCLDAETGRVQWRTFVCGAEPPARNLPYVSHQLLTLEGETLYYNTNLGAVAALNKRNGRLRWVSLYPRSGPPSGGRIGLHWARDLTPCLYDRGVLYVAPADTPSIFALEAATGQILWQTGPDVEDVVHLLGVCEDRLIAAGRRVYGIATAGSRRGQVVFRWPDGPEHLGYGRGLLAEGRIYWPTRNSIHILDARTGQPIRELLLRPLEAGGGNLLASADQWFIAAEKELLCLGGDSLTAENAKENKK